MKQLPSEFTKNDVKYKIVERTETRYFASIHSIETDALISYETGRIHIKKAHKEIIHGREANFTDREVISNDNQFGHDPFECCFPPRDKNLAYDQYVRSQNPSYCTPKSRSRKLKNLKVI